MLEEVLQNLSQGLKNDASPVTGDTARYQMQPHVCLCVCSRERGRQEGAGYRLPCLNNQVRHIQVRDTYP